MFDILGCYKIGAGIWDREHRFDPADRAEHMNASEADRCLRWQWYDKHRHDEAAPQSWGYARRGSLIEAHVVDILRRANLPIDFAGDQQERIVDHTHPIAATPDGEIWDEATGAFVMVEIKTVDPRANKSKLPRARHITQVRLAMDLRQRAVPEETVAGAWLLYVDASNLDDVTAHWVDYRPGTVEAYANRAVRLFKAQKAEQLPAEGVALGDCKQCAFKHICKAGEQAAPVTPGRKPTSTGAKAVELMPLVDRIVALDRMVAEQKRIKDELKAAMIAGRLKEIEASQGTASLTERAGAERFDRKAAEAAGLDLSPFVKAGSPSVALTVSQKET